MIQDGIPRLYNVISNLFLKIVRIYTYFENKYFIFVLKIRFDLEFQLTF